MAKFEDVANELAHRVKSGKYNSSQRLPSEYSLASEFGVSRLTVRKAIDLLIQQQVLVKSPGRGTYAMRGSSKIESGRLGLQGFTEVAKNYGMTSHTEVLSFRPLKNVSEEVESALELSSRLNDEVDELVRRRFWDNEPMTVEHVVIAHEFVLDLTREDFSGSLFEQIEKSVSIAYSQQEIEAVLMDEELAQLLEGKPGDPLLKVYSTTYTADARPIFYDTSYYRADKYTFKSTLTRHRM